ncbi:AfsR/SARP family transcriptional regulator [Amycolatopsis nigrescens]|uniref:AfsR/SARP family transcriptional regulator n=1 Tax=Amycolatopsis nigrescens TaxID=381445 RepID=UPI0003809EF2|nr:BTAD domain-containing putative transcriptional regulator [Amycolatopsis nigrescens]
MQFSVLGPLAASVALPSAGQPRSLLAVLLAKPNEFVHRDQLVDELWPDGAPASATAIVQISVSKLRKALADGDRLRTGPRGYRINVGEGELDADEFLALTGSAAAATDGGRLLLERALRLWRGPALADVTGGPLLEAHKLWLNDRRWSAFRGWAELELRAGRHHEVVDELLRAVTERPTDEPLVAQLVLALERCGRAGDALVWLRRTRMALWEQAGVRPGPELVGQYRRIAGREWTSGGTPAQLPPATPDFAGRSTLLTELATLTRAAAPIVLHGQAGSGKTALAVQTAHRIRRRFPDGQLFAELPGAGGTAEVLGRFLRALGVDDVDLPAEPGELVSLWRGQTAGRRLLVLLDGAASEGQVRALLPSGGGCAVLVTSRRRLAGLVGARPVEVGDLSMAESFELLGGIAGRERLLDEPDATCRLVESCEGHASAVRVAGAKLAQRPHLRVTELAGRLLDERTRLDQLTAGDLSVRAMVAQSVLACRPAERDALRLLGLLGVPEASERTAAALLDLPRPAARDLLDELVDAHLLRAAGRDPLDSVRYRLPGFVRLYAREMPRTAHDDAALRRALESYLSLGDRMLADPAPWCELEAENLAGAVRVASAAGWDELTDRLADLYAGLAGVRPTRPWSGVVSLLGLAAARRRPGQAGAPGKLLTLGTLQSERGRISRARRYFALAEAQFRELGDQCGTGAALIALADVDAELGAGPQALTRLREALDVLRACGDVRGQSVASYQLGSLLEDLGDVRSAVEGFEVSMLLAGKCDDTRLYDQAAKRYADVLRRHGQHDRSAELLADALTGAVRSGDRHWEAHVLRSLGDLHGAAGEFAESRRHLTRSLELFQGMEHRHAAAYTHRGLADACQRDGDPALAEWHLRTALSTFRELGDRRGTGYAMVSLGRIRARAGAVPAAAQTLRKAAGLFRELGFPLWELRALAELEPVENGQDADQAREALAKIRLGW